MHLFINFSIPHNYSFYLCLQYVHRLQISLGQTTLSSLQFPPKNFHRHLKIFNVSFTSFHWSLILLRNMTDTVLNDGISCSGFWGNFRKFSLENEKKKNKKMLTNTKMVKLLGQLSYVFKSSWHAPKLIQTL